MVFVKVRETYDLKTVQNKMTVIGIHTPDPKIIKRNYPGLLMQCRAYRPVSCDVRIACASTLPLDPLGVGTTEGAVAPEDLFNPILYKAMSNFGMSQLEARINQFYYANATGVDLRGSIAEVDVDSLTSQADEFNLYYGLLSETQSWRHANPQAGLEMKGLKPLVYEKLYSVADSSSTGTGSIGDYGPGFPNEDGKLTMPFTSYPISTVKGNGKPVPFMNTTSYSFWTETTKAETLHGLVPPGFPNDSSNSVASNAEINVPWILAYVGAIIVPPSKLHELFYRMVIEWTIEFSSIRPLQEIASWGGLRDLGAASHYQNYSYTSTKEAVTGDTTTIMDKDTTMVSSNVDVNKVM